MCGGGEVRRDYPAVAVIEDGGGGRCAAEIGSQAEFTEEAEFEPEKEGGGCESVGEKVEAGGGKGEEAGVWGKGMCGAEEEVGCKRGARAGSPVVAEGGSGMEGRTFAEKMEVLRCAVVEEEFAGLEEVELAEHPGFGALGAFDEGREAAVGACEPHHDAGGVGHRIPTEDEGLVACDGVVAWSHVGSSKSARLSPGEGSGRARWWALRWLSTMCSSFSRREGTMGPGVSAGPEAPAETIMRMASAVGMSRGMVLERGTRRRKPEVGLGVVGRKT